MSDSLQPHGPQHAIGKTTRPFRYDLNQFPYNYAMEVRNGFKGLDLIECLMNYGWRLGTLYRRQGSRSTPRKRNAKKQNGSLRRPYKCCKKKKKKEVKSKGKIYPFECRVTLFTSV